MNPPVRFDLYQELRPNRARSINDRDYLMVAQVELPAHGLPDRRAGATLEFSVNHEGLFEVTAECTINGRLERSETISTAVD
jgi:hypothetical protein